MRLIQPVGIMFSEYYFYLCAYISVSEEMPDVPKRPFPTIYRIDRIAEFEILAEVYGSGVDMWLRGQGDLVEMDLGGV